jgi:hypothetical protein
MWAGVAHADESPSRDWRDTKSFRFEFDNDTFVGSDDAFTAGWSVQVHSPPRDEWAAGLPRWIGRFPTLGDDGVGGRVVRQGWGITQLIVTPKNVSEAAPQADDWPWAGLLGGYVSWSAYDDRRLAALQLYVGCIGPCSQADDVQRFVHNHLRFGEPPAGWANQLDDDALVNVNYEYRYKVWPGAKDRSRRFGSDVSVGAQGGIGSFATYAEAWVEYRFGWDVPPGFTKFGDPPALGIALDPVFADPSELRPARRSWRPYFNVVARLRSVDEFAPLDSRKTRNGDLDGPRASTPGDEQIIIGVHVLRTPLAFHLAYYRYVDGVDAALAGSGMDWVHFSFERRF